MTAWPTNRPSPPTVSAIRCSRQTSWAWRSHRCGLSSERAGDAARGPLVRTGHRYPTQRAPGEVCRLRPAADRVGLGSPCAIGRSSMLHGIGDTRQPRIVRQRPVDRRICLLRPRDSDALSETAEARRNHLGSHPSGNRLAGGNRRCPGSVARPSLLNLDSPTSWRSHSSSGRLAQGDCTGDPEVVRRCVARPGDVTNGDVTAASAARAFASSRGMRRRWRRRTIPFGVSPHAARGRRGDIGLVGIRLPAAPRSPGGSAAKRTAGTAVLGRRWPDDERWRVIPRPFQEDRPATRSARRSTALPHSGCCLARGWGSTARSWSRS
jgi:hypothetical protein